jgi:hypothetical protein
MSFKEEGFFNKDEMLLLEENRREIEYQRGITSNFLECEYHDVCCNVRRGCDAEEKRKCGLWNGWKSADFALLFKELADNNGNYLFKF